jgi:uncharacterized protein (DUF2249 family)
MAGQSADVAGTDALAATADLLVKALRALGAAGQPDAASQLAARAWWVLRDSRPREAEHINGAMHYLARLPAEPPTREERPMAADPILDVRAEPHARRHTLILGSYGELAPGTGFVLVNDHDPKPLYYQFEAEYKDKFTWDYLEEGPDVWRVRIGRPAA